MSVVMLCSVARSLEGAMAARMGAGEVFEHGRNLVKEDVLRRVRLGKYQHAKGKKNTGHPQPNNRMCQHHVFPQQNNYRLTRLPPQHLQPNIFLSRN
jgi:hypothetical protein